VEVESAGAGHVWSEVELDTFRTLAEMIGTAVTHARNLKQVADAGRILENSSMILYRLGQAPPYRVTYMSRNAERYGYATSQFLSSPAGFPELFHPEDRPSVVAGIAKAIGKGKEVTGEFRLRNAAGAYIWVENHILPVRGEGQRPAALEGLFIDIHSRKIAEIETVRLTHTDLLTGLPNRTAFMERLACAFAQARYRAHHFAMLYLDLDRFKDVNETLGHPAGDELLQAVAGRLKENLRKDDFLARLGGDEFAVIVDGKGGRTAIANAADGILSALVPQHPAAGGSFHISASAGVSMYRAEMKKPEDMMREADLALYDAKEHGGGRYIFHTEAHDLAVRERVTLIEEIRAALDRGQFEVYYQPQVELPSGRIVGLEALLRWNHPKRGLVSPAIFIPVAEKAGSIIPLGRWVLSDVCRQIRIWRNEGIIAPLSAVNVSGAQLFSPSEFERYLMEELLADRIEPEMLEIELTESVLIEASRGHTGMLARLRALGIRIAIDDFGTGYSSLAYLRDYPVDRIKIAQQFIVGLPGDAGSAAIVRATIGLAREFGIEIIAEGVENGEQLDFLVKAGCTNVQGYYFSRPLPADKIPPLLCQGVLTPHPALDGQVAAAAQQPAA
jgi:diguanylate cyclase (GGDEF)-like protein/PAS domain S-box-containing protein